MPECAGIRHWSLLFDTNAPDARNESFDVGDTYEVTGRSTVLFRLRV
jgi:glycogen operon protein